MDMAKDDPKAPGYSDRPVAAPWGICVRCHQPLTRPSTAGGCFRCIVGFIALEEDTGLATAAADSEEVRR